MSERAFTTGSLVRVIGQSKTTYYTWRLWNSPDRGDISDNGRVNAGDVALILHHIFIHTTTTHWYLALVDGCIGYVYAKGIAHDDAT